MRSNGVAGVGLGIVRQAQSNTLDISEGVTAVVVRAPASQITGAEIVGAIAGQLAKYKHPKQVIFVDELPRNTMGKVQKNLLREQHKQLFAPAATVH